jgi:tRNA nucleotidyltransferase (CCA-adding enzyme)
MKEHLLSILCSIPDTYRQLPEVIPELQPMVDFDQHNVHHCFDVWEHTVQCIAHTPEDPVLRLAALFHDIGKPQCFHLDANGVGHSYGHARISADMARAILIRYGFDEPLIDRVWLLIDRHDMQIELQYKYVRRAILRLGEEAFWQLVRLKRADNLAQSPAYHHRQTYYDQLEAIAKTVTP